TLSLCGPQEICVPFEVFDDVDTVVQVSSSLGVVSDGQVCFTAETGGEYWIVLTAVDSCLAEGYDSTLVTVIMNDPPVVTWPDDFYQFICESEEICVDVVIDNPLAAVQTNIGTYNPETGTVCFVADVAGFYTLIVEATDECQAIGADTVNIEIGINSPPEISGLRDTSLYICYPTEICVLVDVTDPDNNIASVDVTGGAYVDDRICFVAYNEGTYELIVTVVDECGLTKTDTGLVHIQTDQGISLECPGDTTVFLCEPDTLCFPIGGIPDGAEVTVDGIATYWNAETKSICFFSDCCLDNTLMVTATTVCGSYSCEFTVYVQTNTPPLVLLPTDTTIVQCELAPVCFPVGVSDIDGNIAEVTTSVGVYDDYRNEVCFTPDTAGTYLISVTAIDSCEATRFDAVAVTVIINHAPTVSFTPIDTVIKQCEPELICIPVDILDIDGNLDEIVVEGGYYDSELNVVCLMPDGPGTYCVTVTATDECGLSDQQTTCVDVADGDYVDIDCRLGPLDEHVLCEPGTVCFSLPISGDNYTVSVDYGTWANDTVCFFADTTGSYHITTIAEAQCNTDTCVVIVPVTILEPLDMSYLADDERFLCEPVVLCYDFWYEPASATVTVSEPAYLSEGQVCVPVTEPGSQTITVTVSNQCGELSDSFDVSASFNSAPTVSAGEDLYLVECELFEICVPIHVSDPDENAVSITAAPYTVVLGEDTTVCFTPPDYGNYEIIVTATDECGIFDVDTVLISISEGDYADISCPDGTQFASICGPDMVCILAPISPVDAAVTILPSGTYDPQTGEICVYVEEGGTHSITVMASAQCSSDTCAFNLEVDMGIPPSVACPDSVDALMCLVDTDTLCFPVNIEGTGVEVNVNPFGYYSAGHVCLPISEPGEYDIEIIAFGSCGVDTCYTIVTVEEDQAPELFLPDNLVFEWCPDDTEVICIDWIWATDTEVESELTITQTCGPGTFTPGDNDSGWVCFVPEEFTTYEFCFEVTDGCNTVTGSLLVDIVLKDDCDVCLRMSIDGGEPTPVGLRKEVRLNIETNDRVGGFDILLGYDVSAISFQHARLEDGAADDWEYFTWHQNVGGCGGGNCPSGSIRFVGIADMNNGGAHPPNSAYLPNGMLIFIEFQVANDQNLGDVFVPISFYWFDCTDNSFSDPTGQILFIDSRIYNAEGALIWDEFDDVMFPETARIPGVGAPDTCIKEGAKTRPLRCAEFFNGGIKIVHPDSIDARGDINLNQLAYEIADAVVFTNYFIRGMDAFTISIAGQIAATDVNADGLTLTVADLALLIRVIIGDADPIPKLIPYQQKAQVSSSIEEGMLSISAETGGDLGTACFTLDI
ncbi:MAG: hypothetical protein DRP45_10635, partial [Candidatus Zixiibacteriota bacterium]